MVLWSFRGGKNGGILSLSLTGSIDSCLPLLQGEGGGKGDSQSLSLLYPGEGEEGGLSFSIL